MAGLYADDIEYAKRRLLDTVVRTSAGNPFHISRIEHGEDDLLVSGRDYVRDENLTLPLGTLNLEPVPLGFVNLSNEMVFTCRKPMRRDWRQGLSHNNLVVYGNIAAGDFPMKLIRQPVLQQYPRFSVAVENIIRGKSSVAFSRDFGLSLLGSALHLIYRKDSVGSVHNGIPRLNPAKFFLQQHLDEVVG